MSNFDIIESRVIQLIEQLEMQEIDAVIINREDEHLSEYLPSDKERLAYITGFTGSAGTAIIFVNSFKNNVSSKRGVLLVDGRYILQAPKQVPNDIYDVYHYKSQSISELITENVTSHGRIGIDPKCISFHNLKNITDELSKYDIQLVSIPNLVDKIWDNKNESLSSKFFIYEDKYNGYPCREKIKSITNILKSKKLDSTVLGKSESINWLLNIRGNDIPNLPIVNCFAIVYSSNHVELFTDLSKFPFDDLPKLQHHCGNIDLFEESKLEDVLKRLGKNKNTVLVDPTCTNSWIINTLIDNGAIVSFGMDVCELPKACKNNIEIEGFKKCHIRDAIAMCRFLAWLDHVCENIKNSSNNANSDVINTITEETLSNQLLKFRQEQDLFIENSFDTISAIGANASLIHYNHKNVGKPKVLGSDPLYLLDSGGQYLDGTTDITRTIQIGQNVTPEMKQNFTRVLKGLIAMHRIKFPEGTTGSCLDILARAPLWQVGLNYDHGTGHGVGHFLNVHEGPYSISQRSKDVPLQIGMVTSVEPGYYKENEYGIRCENLCIIEKNDNEITSNNMLKLTPITFVPFDLRLVDKDLLTINEKQWLNDYHSKVRDLVKEHLSDMEINWLLKATAAI